MSILADALRLKFKDPAKVIARLGLDPNILKEATREAARLAQDGKLRLGRDDFVRTGNTAVSAHPSVMEAERKSQNGGGGDNVTSASVEQVARAMREAQVGDADRKEIIYALVFGEVARAAEMARAVGAG